MKNYFKNPITIIGIILINLFVFIQMNNDYMATKNRKCLILDKLQTSGGYKHSGKFYLVLKDEHNDVFDRSVSPATYSQAKVNNYITFELRQMDIKQTPLKNVMWFFIPIVLLSLGIVLLIFGIIISVEEKNSY